MKAMRPVLASALAAGLSACVHAPAIERAYGGRVTGGRYIDPAAYAASLRGAIADAAGDAKGALAAYGEALRMDPSAAEIWAQIGDIRCRANPRDAQADAGFARALELDASYARAWTGKAECALARGDARGARAAAQRAAELDPAADGANAILTLTGPSLGDANARAAIVAFTVTAEDPLVAWDAMVAWAQANADVPLWGRALRELVRLAPARRDSVARSAEVLAGAGEMWEARGVAAAVANADARPPGGDHALVSRLALDEAIALSDPGAASQRATRVRLPLDEAAGRALLAGERSLASALALAMADADPTAVGARLMVAATGGGDVLGVANKVRSHASLASAAAFVAFGVALVHATSPEHALAALEGISHDPIVPGDDRVVRPAVELASIGALSADSLPPDGVVELAALRGDALREELVAPDASLLDARHEYLALALAHPQAARAKDLATRLRSSRSDPVVATASALIQLATGAPIAAGAPQALLSRDSADPLLATTALRLADKVGDREVARRAREALTAIGGARHAIVE